MPSAAEERYMEDGEEELLDLEGEEEEMHEPALSLTVVETEQVFDSKVEIEGTKAETWTAGVQVRVFRNLCSASHKVKKDTTYWLARVVRAA